MEKKQTKGLSLNITEEQFIQTATETADDAIDQLTTDPVLRELITSMGEDPDEIAKRIKKDKLKLDKMRKPK